METLLPSLAAGLTASAATWFTFARKLTTREEVEVMIRERVEPIKEQQTRLEGLMEGVRSEISALRGDVIRLQVLLETVANGR